MIGPEPPDMGDDASSNQSDHAQRAWPRRVGALPAWRVILHDDTDNEIFEVIDTIAKTLHISRHHAARLTLAAHNHGQSVLFETHFERAEHLRQLLASFNLACTIEPVGDDH